MRIGILASARDPVAAELGGMLNGRSPGAYVALDLDFDAAQPLRLDDAHAALGATDLLNLDTVLVRGFRYMDPVVPDPAVETDWSVWRADYVLEQQRYSTRYALLAELERRGVEVLSPLAAHVGCFSKPDMLDVLRMAALRVPEALCTNDSGEIAAFRARHPELVWRPATGRAAWQRFRSRQQEDLVADHKPPVLLAPIVTGPLIRAWVLRGAPLLCLDYAAPEAEGLESLERYSAQGPGDEARHACARVAEVLRAPWCQITYVEAGRSAWVYDVDPDPRLEWLPPVFREQLLDAVARALLGEHSPATVAASTTAHERPLPFLRRMLRDLFTYEASKYPDDQG